MELQQVPIALLEDTLGGRAVAFTGSASPEEIAIRLAPQPHLAPKLAQILRAASPAGPVSQLRRTVVLDGTSLEVRISSDGHRTLAITRIVSRDCGAETFSAPLSPRERDVLELLVQGLSNKQVAAALFISPRTAEKHRAAIYRKTSTRSLAVLTRIFLAGAEEAECATCQTAGEISS